MIFDRTIPVEVEWVSIRTGFRQKMFPAIKLVGVHESAHSQPKDRKTFYL